MVPTASASGTLGDKPLAHLLVYLHDKRLTGTLELKSDDAESATIVFWRGRVIKVKTSTPIAYLGSVLYELGIIDVAELDASLLQLAKTKVPHGQILLERRAITREQLSKGIAEQTLRKLTHIFGFRDATTFAFYTDLDLLPDYGGRDPVPVDPFPAIWRGVRDVPPTEHVRGVLASIGASRCLLVPNANIDRFQFPADERAVVECLRVKPMSVDELRSLHVLPTMNASLLVYCLFITKQAEVHSSSGPSPRREPRESGTRPALPPEAQTARTPPAARAQPTTTERVRDWIAASGAKTDVQAIRVYLNRNDLDRAECLARVAHEERPEDPEALSLLAWVEALRPENQSVEATHVRIAMLSEANRMDCLCQSALYFRAQLHARLENHRSAIRDLRAVLDVNAEHPDAVRALRVYHMRARSGSLKMRAVDPNLATRTSATSGVMSRTDASTIGRTGRKS